MSEDELRAGRELDALVAEKVMGWGCIGFDKIGNVWAGVSLNRNGQQEVIHYYSENIAAAWQVVEKMKENPNMFMEFANNVEYVCGAHNYFPDGNGWVILKNLTPLKICRAALKAMME